MLSDPNTSSPANVDASVEFRDRRAAFADRVKKLAEKTQKGVPDYVKIPHPDTDPEERAKAIKKYAKEATPFCFCCKQALIWVLFRLKLLQEEDTAWMEEDPGDMDDDMLDMSDDDGDVMGSGSEEEPVDDDE